MIPKCASKEIFASLDCKWVLYSCWQEALWTTVWPWPDEQKHYTKNVANCLLLSSEWHEVLFVFWIHMLRTELSLSVNPFRSNTYNLSRNTADIFRSVLRIPTKIPDVSSWSIFRLVVIDSVLNLFLVWGMEKSWSREYMVDFSLSLLHSQGVIVPRCKREKKIFLYVENEVLVLHVRQRNWKVRLFLFCCSGIDDGVNLAFYGVLNTKDIWECA